MDPRGTTWISEAEVVLGIKLKYHVEGQATGPCPKCGGEDRFVVFVEGNSWCRQCRHKRWWRRAPGDVRTLVAEERARREEIQRAAREEMSRCMDWTGYNEHCMRDSDAFDLWMDAGMQPDQVARWGLGYCASCPTAHGRPSLTIPVFYRGILRDIRHRLVNAPSGDKYRSHVAGLLPHPFNLDSLDAAMRILVVEGEKKAIALSDAGFPAVVGLPGVTIYAELVQALDRAHPEQEVILMLDPGTDKQMQVIAAEVVTTGIQVRLADAWAKPDELLAVHGKHVIDTLIKQSRRYVPKRRS